MCGEKAQFHHLLAPWHQRWFHTSLSFCLLNLHTGLIPSGHWRILKMYLNGLEHCSFVDSNGHHCSWRDSLDSWRYEAPICWQILPFGFSRCVDWESIMGTVSVLFTPLRQSSLQVQLLPTSLASCIVLTSQGYSWRFYWIEMGARSVLPECIRARSGATATFWVNGTTISTKELLLEGGQEGTWAMNLGKKGYEYEVVPWDDIRILEENIHVLPHGLSWNWYVFLQGILCFVDLSV